MPMKKGVSQKLKRLRKTNQKKDKQLSVFLQETSNKEIISIKAKLIVSHILIAVLPILIVVIILTSLASDSLLEKVNSSNMAYVSKVTKILDGKIKSVEDIARIILSDIDLNNTIRKDKDDYENAYLMLKDRETNFDKKVQALEFSNDMIKSIVLVKEEEFLGKDPYNLKQAFEDFYSSEEYIIVKEASTNVVWFSNLYDTEDLFLMRNINSITSGKFIGVLIIQIDNKLLADDLTSDFGELAQLAILDSVGQVIVTPEEQEGLQEIKYFSQIQEDIGLKDIESEAIIGTLKTENDIVLYGQCLNEWMYILQIPTSEFLGDINKIRTIAIILTIITILLAVIIGIWIALSISKPIEYIRNKIRLVEQGDLTVESKYVGKHEIGQLSLNFNHMTMNMRNLLKEVGIVAERVSTNSNDLNHIAANSAHSSKEVMTAMESIATGASEQAKDSEKTMVVIKELVSHFNATEKHFSYVVEASNKTKTCSEDAKLTLETLNLTTSDTINLSQNIKKDIKNLVNRFDDISSIIGIIDGISEQTNLLSLNAAIEAARAGKSGRGFAVVADEVRKLAMQSSDAVRNISSIISSIYEDTIRTEKMIENGSTIYTKQEQAVNNTETIFKEIVGNMETITKEVDSVYSLLEGLDQVQVKATDSITSIAAIAEESAAAIEEVLASGQEQMATTDQLVHMSVELANVIKVMGEQMNQFNIEKSE